MQKICFAASSGGHLEQLMMMTPIMDENDSFIVTEKTPYASVKDRKVYYLSQVNRKELKMIPLMIKNSIMSLHILVKEKPDVIITTGVLAVIPLCLLGKLLRKRLIYIESFAKITDATLSGKLLYKFADVFYVQWEDMLKVFPNARFVGGIY